MLSRYMNRQLVPVVAMLVAFAWASFTASPVRNSGPLPLPSDYVASSPSTVIHN